MNLGRQEQTMKQAAARATFDDVNLVLKLYDMRREPRLREARRWFTGSFKAKTFEDFAALCPVGSEQHASYRMFTTYWEMVASFVTSGVLNQELFFQSGRELLFCWERVRDLLPLLREQYRNPLELKNVELVATAYIEWWNANAPGAYEAFSRRVRG
jgi:hypothetical protein